MRFKDSFIDFLKNNSIEYLEESSLDTVRFIFDKWKLVVTLLPKKGGSVAHFDDTSILAKEGFDYLYLYEDRWWSGGEVIQKRILSRVGVFKSVFARKCNIIQGGQYSQIFSHFLESNHSYGEAKAKYKYGLQYGTEVVAVATFSKPRTMPRPDGNTYLSFEWVRYASIPGVRVIGGMGKVLQAFLKDARVLGERLNMPIEVMSYSDIEWSNGRVYDSLGFKEIGVRAPVLHYVNNQTYERISLRKYKLISSEEGDYYPIYNMGSRKLLLTLK